MTLQPDSRFSVNHHSANPVRHSCQPADRTLSSPHLDRRFNNDAGVVSFFEPARQALYLFRLAPLELGCVRSWQRLFILCFGLQADVFCPFQFGQEKILAIEDPDKIPCSARRLFAPSVSSNIDCDLVAGYLIHIACFDLASAFKFLMEPGQGLARCFELTPVFVSCCLPSTPDIQKRPSGSSQEA